MDTKICKDYLDLWFSMCGFQLLVLEREGKSACDLSYASVLPIAMGQVLSLAIFMPGQVVGGIALGKLALCPFSCLLFSTLKKISSVLLFSTDVVSLQLCGGVPLSVQQQGDFTLCLAVLLLEGSVSGPKTVVCTAVN